MNEGTCATCRFHHQGKSQRIRCRRYPKVLMLAFPAEGLVPGQPRLSSVWDWPIMEPDDTCGEFRPKLNGKENASPSAN